MNRHKARIGIAFVIVGGHNHLRPHQILRYLGDHIVAIQIILLANIQVGQIGLCIALDGHLQIGQVGVGERGIGDSNFAGVALIADARHADRIGQTRMMLGSLENDLAFRVVQLRRKNGYFSADVIVAAIFRRKAIHRL